MMNWCASLPVVMRQHLGPSSARTAFAHVVGLVLALAAPVLAASTTLPWYQPAPRDADEALFAKTLAESGPGDARARVVLGQVAPVPWLSAEAAQALAGKAITEATAEAAAKAALAGATPLSQNAYKVQLARVAVKRALLAAARRA